MVGHLVAGVPPQRDADAVVELVGCLQFFEQLVLVAELVFPLEVAVVHVQQEREGQGQRDQKQQDCDALQAAQVDQEQFGKLDHHVHRREGPLVVVGLLSVGVPHGTVTLGSGQLVPHELDVHVVHLVLRVDALDHGLERLVVHGDDFGVDGQPLGVVLVVQMAGRRGDPGADHRDRTPLWSVGRGGRIRLDRLSTSGAGHCRKRKRCDRADHQKLPTGKPSEHPIGPFCFAFLFLHGNGG